MASRKMRTTTVEDILTTPNHLRRRRRATNSLGLFSEINESERYGAPSSVQPKPIRTLLPTPLRNRSDSMPLSSSMRRPGAFSSLAVTASTLGGRDNDYDGSRRLVRTSSLESMEDENEHRKEPMLTVVSSPRDRAVAARQQAAEFWSKNNARRYRRTGISALCPYPNLLDTARHLRSNITVGSRRKVLFGTKHTQVFSGKTAQSFLHEYVCDDQSDAGAARDIGTWMMREQFIVPVEGRAKTGGSLTSGKVFSSSKDSLYRFNDAMLSPYHLHVIVHRATGLLGKRNDGTSYPFAILEANDQIGSTRVLNHTLTPRWEEKFLFGLYDYNEGAGGSDRSGDGGSSNRRSGGGSSNSRRDGDGGSGDIGGSGNDGVNGMALRATVWTEKIPFLQQHKKAFLGGVNIPWKDVPFIEDTDRSGMALRPPAPMTLQLQKRSVRSRVSGTVTITAYVTRYNYSSYLRTRCHSSPIIESDPTFSRSKLAKSLDGKILIPKTRKEMSRRGRSGGRSGGRNGGSRLARDAGESRAREQVDTALKVTDFILWDLILDLDSLNDIDYRGIASDLKVASALLLPGMSWKQRVIAHIRSPTKDWLTLASGWIRRSQSVFPSSEGGSGSGRSGRSGGSDGGSSNSSGDNVIRVNGLSSDDVENNVLHLRVRQDNTWSLDKSISAGRELGRTAEFPLSTVPKILVPSGMLVVPPAYIEYPMTAYTSMARKRRTANGNIRAAMYLVPSELDKEDVIIARQLTSELIGQQQWEREEEGQEKGRENGEGRGEEEGEEEKGEEEREEEEEKEWHSGAASRADLVTKLSTVFVESKTMIVTKTLSSRRNIILEMTMRAPYELIHHYVISDHSLFMSMYLGREGSTSVSVGKWEEVPYAFMVDHHLSAGRSGGRSAGGGVSSKRSSPFNFGKSVGRSGRESISPAAAAASGLTGSGHDSESGGGERLLDFSSEGESDEEEIVASASTPLAKKLFKRSLSFTSLASLTGRSSNKSSPTSFMKSGDDEVDDDDDDDAGGGGGSSRNRRSPANSVVSEVGESGSIDTSSESVKNAVTYTRRIFWCDSHDGTERVEIQVIRKHVRGLCVVDAYRSCGGKSYMWR